MKMHKPYIICHMLTSLDGKIAGDFLEQENTIKLSDEYYRIHREWNADAFLCGRVTMEKSFTHGHQVDLSQYQNQKVNRDDYIATFSHFYAVAIDPSGKLGWTDHCLIDEDPGYDQAHIIEVLNENVQDAYLCYLREKGISYIFGGKDQLNMGLVCHKLYTLFHIQTLLLEGGGIVNGSFAREKLIDEISLILTPIVENTSDSHSLFESYQSDSLLFQLDHIQKLDHHGLWLTYKKM